MDLPKDILGAHYVRKKRDLTPMRLAISVLLYNSKITKLTSSRDGLLSSGVY
jgi:hypothetical protein